MENRYGCYGVACFINTMLSYSTGKRKFLLLISLISVFSTEPPGDPTVSRCPRFVSEGEIATCECQIGFYETPPSDFSLSWPGHSDTPLLKKTNVTRRDNGTVFTCLMVWDGRYRMAHYILQVAYGPEDPHTTILGPSAFIADGTTTLTLTCRASDVNPNPIYTWDTDRCEKKDMNTGICTFIPQPFTDDGLQVKCHARSRAGRGNMGTAKFVINLQYPPREPPLITGHTPDDVISHDSQLKCTVKGGKPPVSKVIFTCGSVQQVFKALPSSQSEDSVVSSSLITNKDNDDKNDSILCTCGGVWEPRKDLYTLTSQRFVLLPTDNKDGTSCKHVGTIAGISFAIVVFCCVVCIVISCVHYKQSRRLTSTERDKQCEQPLTAGVSHSNTNRQNAGNSLTECDEQCEQTLTIINHSDTNGHLIGEEKRETGRWRETKA